MIVNTSINKNKPSTKQCHQEKDRGGGLNIIFYLGYLCLFLFRNSLTWISKKYPKYIKIVLYPAAAKSNRFYDGKFLKCKPEYTYFNHILSNYHEELLLRHCTPFCNAILLLFPSNFSPCTCILPL